MNKHLFNETVTVYTYVKNAAGLETMIRTVVPNCHWEENSVAVAIRTGVQIANNVNLVIMRERDNQYPKQLRPEQWLELPTDDPAYLEQFYSFALQSTFAQTNRVYRGILDHRFTWATTTAADRVAIQLNNFITKYPAARVIKDVNWNWYSRRNLHHVEVRT